MPYPGKRSGIRQHFLCGNHGIGQFNKHLSLSYKLFQLCEVFLIWLTYHMICHYNNSNAKMEEI